MSNFIGKNPEPQFCPELEWLWWLEVCACLYGRQVVCVVCVSVCVFSFKRRKTTVVTERSRKISYQIAEPILVPRGLKLAEASTINATPSSTPSKPHSAL